VNFGDVQATWAAHICSALFANGVRHVVVSPGSRSTALVLALQQAEMTAHAIVDERSAAFFALGIARVRREPVALFCTSGSAGAHYLPAMIEAFETGHTLVAVTADRPPELHRLGASQTTEQVGFYGRHVVWSGTLGMAAVEKEHLTACMAQVTQAVHSGLRERGPVHINVPMRKPFEPTGLAAVAPVAPVSLTVGRHAIAPSAEAVIEAAALITEAAEGWVIAGPCSLDAEAVELVQEFCARSGFLLLAEHGSNLRDSETCARSGASFRRADGFELSLERMDAAALVPDVVVQIGRSPIHKALTDALGSRRGTFRHLLLSEDRWHDAARSVSHVLFGSFEHTLSQLNERLPEDGQREETPKADSVCDRSEKCWEHAFATLLGAEDAATEPGLVRALVAQLPDGGQLFVGNSQPIRDIGHFCAALPASVGVLTQRGAAGIDGNLAGVFGASTVARGPVTALIGDVTFLHDIGSLALANSVSNTTVIVVVNNDGGRIFDQLPVASSDIEPDIYAKFWTTSSGLSPSGLSKGFGVDASAVETLSAFASAAARAYSRQGVSVIEVRVDPALSARIRHEARQCPQESA
jgi:2-succinyl-5-enolpyruvyl-6-hydroxy-3-cyclohexene-1-carboxylate synthase